jgi:serine protease
LLWYFPGGTPTVLPSAPTASVTYGTPGTYDAILYTIGGGCSLFDSAFVSITVNPTPTISVSGNNTICNGASTPLTASGAGAFTWTPGTGLSATTGASVTANPTVTTTYAINGTLGSCSNSTTITINVDDPSVASIAFVDSMVACPTSVSFDGSNSTHADSFSWTFPGGTPATSNSSSPTVTFGTNGNVTVQLITVNTCGSDTMQFPIQITTNCGLGLNDLDINYVVSLDPEQSVIHIVSDQGLTSGSSIELYNEMGQLLSSHRIANQVTSFEIPVAAYSSGMYFVRILSDTHEVTSKVIK